LEGDAEDFSIEKKKKDDGLECTRAKAATKVLIKVNEKRHSTQNGGNELNFLSKRKKKRSGRNTTDAK